jgi:hypothetical protein
VAKLFLEPSLITLLVNIIMISPTVEEAVLTSWQMFQLGWNFFRIFEKPNYLVHTMKMGPEHFTGALNDMLKVEP